MTVPKLTFKADWTFASKEIVAEHLEDLRKYCWAIDWAFGNITKSDDEFNPPPYDQNHGVFIDGHMYGYIIGELIQYENDWWICESNFQSPAHNNPPPFGWKKWPRKDYYHDYDVNSYRFLLAGHGASFLHGERFLLEADKWLPPQVKANTQLRNTGWQRFTYFWAGDKVFRNEDNTMYEALQDHRSSERWDMDLAKWRVVDDHEWGMHLEPSPHHWPVEFADQMTGLIGATMGKPLRYGGPTPWADQYNYYGENQPDDDQFLIGKYVNPKVGAAYQSHVEYLCNKLHSWWPGPEYQCTHTPKHTMHELGYGTDPSGIFRGHPQTKNNFPFNRSAFEEILHLATGGTGTGLGDHDWYLDINAPPETNGSPKSLACWRRTWKYAMNFPAGIENTMRLVVASLAAVPTAGSFFTVGDLKIIYADPVGGFPPFFPGTATITKSDTFIIIPTAAINEWIGFEDDDLSAIQDWYNEELAALPFPDGFEHDSRHVIMVNTVLAILLANKGWNARLYRIGTDDGYGGFTSPWYYDIVLGTELNNVNQLNLSGTPWNKVHDRTYGGVTLMWPKEWGNPPEPPTNWGDFEAVIKILEDLEKKWNDNPAMMSEMVKRHTLNFAPIQPTYWHPEAVKQMLIDMKKCLDYLRYKPFGMTVEAWPTTKSSPPNLSQMRFSSYSAAVNYLKGYWGGQAWKIAGPPHAGLSGADSAGFSFGAGCYVDGANLYVSIDGACQSWAVQAVSDVLYRRGYREAMVMLGIEDIVLPFPYNLNQPGATKFCPPGIEGASAGVLAQYSTPEYHYTAITMPLLEYIDENGPKKFLNAHDTTGIWSPSSVYWDSGGTWRLPDDVSAHPAPSDTYIVISNGLFGDCPLGGTNIEHVHISYDGSTMIHCNPFEAPMYELPHLGVNEN
jgi:hypothetical protein